MLLCFVDHKTMRIHNGDHLEYELENINTPPKERSDWPLPSFDAVDWAEAFCKIAKQQGHDIDEGWMISWFAGALMRGFDEGIERSQKTTS
jgi:hypothetical protein